jgi:hypothetical protein
MAGNVCADTTQSVEELVHAMKQHQAADYDAQKKFARVLKPLFEHNRSP